MTNAGTNVLIKQRGNKPRTCTKLLREWGNSLTYMCSYVIIMLIIGTAARRRGPRAGEAVLPRRAEGCAGGITARSDSLARWQITAALYTLLIQIDFDLSRIHMRPCAS
jgi:hypothetical protein